MVGCVKDELQAMKNGLTDVIPPELLSGLTAEVNDMWNYNNKILNLFILCRISNCCYQVTQLTYLYKG